MSIVINLPVGFEFAGKTVKEIELLPANGVAEKIYTKKLPEKPYTWQARVISASVKSIADIPIAAKCRQEFLEHGDFTIPEAVKAMTMADMNTLLVEIHRHLWESVLPEQEFSCKFCTKVISKTVDLFKIDFLEEDKKFFETSPDLTKIVAYLKNGFVIDGIKELDREDYVPYLSIAFNKLTYKPPTVKIAIQNERFAEDNVVFWRRIAFDSLLSIQAVEFPDTPEEKLIAELPSDANTFLGTRFYDLYLAGKDLKIIREELSEYLPTLPFYYIDTCPCEKAKEIPHVMEATGFFSE